MAAAHWSSDQTLIALSIPPLTNRSPSRWKSIDKTCCSVLQCVAVCCSVLQCVAVCCSVLPFWRHLHAYTRVHTRVHTHIHTCAPTHLHVYAYAHICTHDEHPHTQTHTHTHIHAHTHTLAHAHTRPTQSIFPVPLLVATLRKIYLLIARHVFVPSDK